MRLFFCIFPSKCHCFFITAKFQCWSTETLEMNRVTNQAKLAYKKVTHVILDLDGLLLDSEHLYAKAVQNSLNKFGKTYDRSLRVDMLGLPGRASADAIVANLNLPLTGEEFYQMVREQYPSLLPDAELLPDTESIYKRVFIDIAKNYGREYTREIQEKVKGRVETDGAVIAVNEMKLPISPEEFLQKYKTMAATSLIGVPFMPGAEKLVRHLYQQKVPIAVATSSGRDTYDLKVEKHKELFALFSHIVTAGTDPEVKNGKPSPDVFLVCASRFKDKPKPEQCLVFEDAPNGVEAALSAGMQVVMVPDESTDPSLCQKATLKLDSLEEVQLELFGLPPFN